MCPAWGTEPDVSDASGEAIVEATVVPVVVLAVEADVGMMFDVLPVTFVVVLLVAVVVGAIVFDVLPVTFWDWPVAVTVV